MRDREHTTLQASGEGRFYTDSLYLAAFLVAHGLRLESTETDASVGCRFGLRDTIERDRLVRRFRLGPLAMVDARTYMYALEELKDRADRARRIVEYND